MVALGVTQKCAECDDVIASECEIFSRSKVKGLGRRLISRLKVIQGLRSEVNIFAVEEFVKRRIAK